MRRTRLIHSTWDEFSRKFAKQQRLPLGTALHLYDASGRKKRSDLQVKRKKIGSVPRADGSQTVHSLLQTATNLLSTDINARRLKIRLASPQGDLIPGNTHVRTVRELPRRRTEHELAVEAQRILEIDYLRREVQRVADREISEAEHLLEEPHDVVPHAYLFALCDRYGRDSVTDALETI